MSFFRTSFAEDIFQYKYAHEGCETWDALSRTLVEDVCQDMLSKSDKEDLIHIHTKMQFIAGGRYLYYAGRKKRFYNNCFLLKAEEDTREDWANLSWKSESALLTGGGIGTDYSIYRPAGSRLGSTGGVASGPIPKMMMINEIGRFVQQGGARRSAIYASLDWDHADASTFLTCKNWDEMVVPNAHFDDGSPITIAALKERDFNFVAPLDMTNISLNYNNSFLEQLYGMPKEVLTGKLNGKVPQIVDLPDLFVENVHQAMRTGEPGLSFNFFEKEKETLRNACTEVTSEDDSDVCNLGSINMSKIDTIQEFRHAIELGIKFLMCGTIRGQLPYAKIHEVREKNRRLGLGLMGIHEWLLKRGYRYEVVPELHEWLQVYQDETARIAKITAHSWSISEPVATRAIAPTGTIGIMACTTTGIEPLFATAYKRRYLKSGHAWHYQYVVDGTAKALIDKFDLEPENIETAINLSRDPERRVKFQADVQDYVDQGISSTINLEGWGTTFNNQLQVEGFATMLAKYVHRLRGFTAYPDGARGGQPLTPVNYHEALQNEGEEFEEKFMDVCELTGGGSCGV